MRAFVIILSLFVLSDCDLLLQDKFATLSTDNWKLDLDGSSSQVTLKKTDVLNETRNALTARTSFCGESELCYRAEVATALNLRESIFKIPGEYWIGFSMRIPNEWEWLGKKKRYGSDITYFMQVHGGDNLGRSPMIGLRNMGKELSVNICGNEKHNSPEESCIYKSLGPTIVGSWVAWVIHVKFAYDRNDGFFEVWKDNKLKVSKSRIVTAYDDNFAPYLKLGAYQLNWKSSHETKTQWVGFEYSEVRIGDVSSSYDEVYTGSSADLLVEDISKNGHSGGSKKTAKSLSGLQTALVVLGCIWVLCILYCCCKRPSKESLTAKAGTFQDKPVNTYNYSIPYFSRAYQSRQSGYALPTYTSSWAKQREAAKGADDDETSVEMRARAELDHITRLNTKRNSYILATPAPKSAQNIPRRSGVRVRIGESGVASGGMSSQQALQKRLSSTQNIRPNLLATAAPGARSLHRPPSHLRASFVNGNGLDAVAGWSSPTPGQLPPRPPQPPPPPPRRPLGSSVIQQGSNTIICHRHA
jgi:hypothetical protein